ncbi:MAG: GntR family transcriptional regulator [Erysipelotrichaceae bacterium]|nr:GntR family transcriptional regulator [Erysipelotrichaceae bacterium]
MKIIVNNTSMTPIYEQITDQIKKMVSKEILKENDPLPSVRSLANELKISALTVKKAYDYLESEGYIETVHGKGSYIKAINGQMLSEHLKVEIENDMEELVSKALRRGLSKEEIRDIFELIMEEK